MRRLSGSAVGRLVTRRDAIGAAVVTLAGLSIPFDESANRLTAQPPNRLKQSVSRWPYKAIPLPEFCRACKGMGLSAIDLLAPVDPDALLDDPAVEERYKADNYLPYWPIIWPSGR